MMYIDPHVHMTSRTTDDYEAMAAAGVVAGLDIDSHRRTQFRIIHAGQSTFPGWGRLGEPYPNGGRCADLLG